MRDGPQKKDQANDPQVSQRHWVAGTDERGRRNNMAATNRAYEEDCGGGDGVRTSVSFSDPPDPTPAAVPLKVRARVIFMVVSMIGGIIISISPKINKKM